MDHKSEESYNGRSMHTTLPPALRFAVHPAPLRTRDPTGDRHAGQSEDCFYDRSMCSTLPLALR